MTRVAPILALLALALLQLPWTFCPCDECGFCASTGDVACNHESDHAHAHSHAQSHAQSHAHSHAQSHAQACGQPGSPGHPRGCTCEHEDHAAHAHDATMLAVLPYAGDVVLDDAGAAFLPALPSTRDAEATLTSNEGVVSVPWAGLPTPASPDAGTRLLL